MSFQNLTKKKKRSKRKKKRRTVGGEENLETDDGTRVHDGYVVLSRRRTDRSTAVHARAAIEPRTSYQRGSISSFDSYESTCKNVERLLRTYAERVDKIDACAGTIRHATSLNRSELRRLRARAQETNEVANELNGVLRTFSAHYRNGSLSDVRVEERGRRHRAFVRESAALQKRFDAALKVALNAEKSIRQQRTNSAAYAMDEDDDDEEQQQLVQYVGEKELEGEITFCEALLEERERGIEKLQQEMVALSEMFQDLNSIIMDSRADVETIEGNMTRTHHQASKGLEHVRKGDEYQSSTRKTLMCTTLCLLVFLGAMLIYFLVLDSTTTTL